MPGTGYDVIIDGVKAKISRSADGGGYEERTVRAEISQQLISQQQDVSIAQRSRPDGASMYQTSWSGGSRWWKPLLSGEEVDSYFYSNNMDLWTEPGKVKPLNAISSLSLNIVTKWFRVGNSLYGINESDDSVDSTHLDVALWTPGSNAWVDVSGLHSTVNNSAAPVSATYDVTDAFIYIMTSDGELNRFNIAGTEAAAWITGQSFNRHGATIFIHQGSVWVWDGDTLRTVDKATPELDEQFDDGLGVEALGSLVVNRGRLAVPTPEGIYYAKNVDQNGETFAYIFRIDRDASGAYIGQPVATLPPGSVALDITYHLGSLIVSTSPQPTRVMDNSYTETGEAVFYYVTPETMGVLGSIRDPENGKAAWSFMGTDGPRIIIGSEEDLWVYDAVAGGLHHLLSTGSSATHFAPEFAVVKDSAGAQAYLMKLNSGNHLITKLHHHTNPDTVSAFGDDETYYTLESNYFDAGLPMESKQLNKVEILFDPGTQTMSVDNQEWTVQISADDGSFTDVITSADTGYDTLSGYAVGWADLTGRRFRYKLIYQTKTAVKLALRAIMATFVTGEMVREWHLTLDGSEFRNVGNEVVRPRVFLDAMRAVIGDEDVVPFINNFEDINQDVQTDATPVYVKVQQASIVKSEPGESIIQVVLREDPYHST